MTARQSSMSDSIKSIIGDLVRCCGEPYVAAPEVIELLYTQLCSSARQLISGLRSQRLSLENILSIVQNDPLRLARVVDYYRVLDSGYGEDGTLRNLEDDEETYLSMIMLKGNGLKRLMNLSAQLKIQIADEDRALLPRHYAPFVEGRRLRLERIDRKITQLSVDEYLKFSKMRQSASLLTLVKPSTRRAFWRWISEQCPDVDSPVDQSVRYPSSLSEELRVLVHVLTGDLLHVIDLTLYYRQKLGIELSSPLTPVELKQAAHMKSVKFAASKIP
ncbi:hypothetical protein CRM22_002406 [Opisthorchis felineus]|uniref:Uncharacterized protein n=1 Tax=Opisthorchis felineus TaxID=147828 RepID=A0A4S2M664_OPIFE|nr:hypothetical protein CRM22_002406 [Opisthorchis felineus]